MGQHIQLQYYNWFTAHSISIMNPPRWHQKPLFPLDIRFRLGFLLSTFPETPYSKRTLSAHLQSQEECGHWMGGCRRHVKPLHIHLKHPRKCFQMTYTMSKQVILWETAQVLTFKNFYKNSHDCHFPIRMMTGFPKTGLKCNLWADVKDGALVSARREDCSSFSRGKHWWGFNSHRLPALRTALLGLMITTLTQNRT